MDSEKIVGYLLLVVGVGMILVSTFSVYQVFTGQKKAPRLFSFEMPGISLPAQQSLEIELPEGMSLPEGVSLPKSTSGGSSELKLFPDEAVNDIANMSIYLFLMGFIASSGAKIAGIGTKLIKDIKVVVKEEKIKQAVAGSSTV